MSDFLPKGYSYQIRFKARSDKSGKSDKKQELRALRQDALAVCAPISEQCRVMIRTTVVFTVTAAVVVEVIVVGSREHESFLLQNLTASFATK